MSVLVANTQMLRDAVPRLKDKRVLILGDIMLDVYLEGDAERISPEAPVPVVSISGERRMLGGAANVAHNIRALGGLPHLIGMCGPGRDGDLLETLLEEACIGASLLRSSSRRTCVKTRVLARGQQMLWLDKEDRQPPDPAEAMALRELLEDLLPQYDVLILSDYAKGCITPELCETVRRIAAFQERPPHILVDPKPANAACYHGVSLIKPNRKEAGQLAGMEVRGRQDILEAGRAIMQKYGSEQLLITLGGEGMALFMRDGTVWNIPTAARSVFDVTGAGDTVMATVALALAAGIVLPVACSLANYAAGGVVEHVGVATVDGPTLLRLVEHGVAPEFIHWM